MEKIGKKQFRTVLHRLLAVQANANLHKNIVLKACRKVRFFVRVIALYITLFAVRQEVFIPKICPLARHFGTPIILSFRCDFLVKIQLCIYGIEKLYHDKL